MNVPAAVFQLEVPRTELCPAVQPSAAPGETASMSGKGQSAAQESMVSKVLLNVFYVGLWIFLSGTVILYNKWILALYGFPYPVALTMWHMAFSSVCSKFSFVVFCPATKPEFKHLPGLQDL